ncbi:MAG: ABC transporter substrate-binding protein [Magnetococcus sp. DMHC-6]
MKHSIQIFLFIFGGLFSISSSAGPLQTTPEVIKLAVSISIPPFFIKELDSGIEMEIIKESFAQVGYQILPIFYIDKPRIAAFVNKDVACASTIPSQTEIKGFLSDPVITLETTAITLTEKNFKIDHVSDLANKNIIAFKGAKKILGPSFNEVVANNLHYRERLKNAIQPVLLYRKRVEVVLSDPIIFDYFRLQMASQLDIEQPITIHHIFTPKNFHLICHSNDLIQAFNTGLAKIRAEGLIPKLYQRLMQPPPAQTVDTPS